MWKSLYFGDQWVNHLKSLGFRVSGNSIWEGYKGDIREQY